MQNRGILAEVNAPSSAHLNNSLMEIGTGVRCEDFADATEDFSPSGDFVPASAQHKCYRFTGGEALGLRRGTAASPSPLRWFHCVDRGSFSADLNLEAVIRTSHCPEGQSCDAFRLARADVAFNVQPQARD